MARSNIGPLVFVIVLGAFVVGCSAAASGAPSGPSGTNLPSGAPTVAASPSPSASSHGPGETTGRPSIPALSFPIGSPGVSIVLPASVLDLVLGDATTRSGVPREQLVVVTAESHTWSDGSLGCPVPGQLYTQALVEGWQAVVRAGTTLYDYRGAGLTNFKLCKSVPG